MLDGACPAHANQHLANWLLKVQPRIHWRPASRVVLATPDLCFATPKAPNVAARLKSLGTGVDGLLSEEERAILDALPASLAAPKTSPVTPGSFRLVQKIISKGSAWPDKYAKFGFILRRPKPDYFAIFTRSCPITWCTYPAVAGAH